MRTRAAWATRLTVSVEGTTMVRRSPAASRARTSYAGVRRPVARSSRSTIHGNPSPCRLGVAIVDAVDRRNPLPVSRDYARAVGRHREPPPAERADAGSLLREGSRRATGIIRAVAVAAATIIDPAASWRLESGPIQVQRAPSRPLSQYAPPARRRILDAAVL